MINKILNCFTTYKVISFGYKLETETKENQLSIKIAKNFFGYLKYEGKSKNHFITFDIYQKQNEIFQMRGICFTDEGWIEMGYKQRNKIKKCIQEYLKKEYIVGNYKGY